MPLHWIQICLLSFGIVLFISLFLRSSFLIKKHYRKLDELQKNLETGMVVLGHKIDLVDRRVQDLALDVKDLNIRTTIVETRMEERSPAFQMSRESAPKVLAAAAKRGRPRKNPEK